MLATLSVCAELCMCSSTTVTAVIMQCSDAWHVDHHESVPASCKDRQAPMRVRFPDQADLLVGFSQQASWPEAACMPYQKLWFMPVLCMDV